MLKILGGQIFLRNDIFPDGVSAMAPACIGLLLAGIYCIRHRSNGNPASGQWIRSDKGHRLIANSAGT
jgi:hypothetical protein